jgi:hypothetical protein
MTLRTLFESEWIEKEGNEKNSSSTQVKGGKKREKFFDNSKKLFA